MSESIPLPHRTPTEMMNPFLPHGKDYGYFIVLSVPVQAQQQQQQQQYCDVLYIEEMFLDLLEFI